MDKRRWQADSARKTGLDSILQDVLTVVETGDGGTTKKVGIIRMGADFACSGTTRGAMAKWSWQADSAWKTGLDSTFQDVLTVVESGGGGDNKKSRDHQNGGWLCL